MSMTMEFETTMQNGALEPQPPEGDGWMLAGSANAISDIAPPAVGVYMYWQRPKTHAAKVCSECRAIAFVNGKCVGCKTPLEN